MAKYAQYYDYLTNRGVMVPDTSVVLSEIEDQMKELFGQELDTAPTTPQGRIIEMLQRSRTFTIQAMAAISNMFNLNKANGFVLDDLGALFLISRQPATYTTTTVILNGVAGTIIPAGTRLKTTNGDIFVATQQYTIGNGVPAVFRAENPGPVPCPPNSLRTILDFVNGLETVDNPGQPTLGTDLESDNSFRNRIKNSLNINSIAVISAIKSNLEAVPGVIGSYCYDNFTNAQVNVDDILVPAHSILAVVDGGDKNDIAQVLYNKKTIGAGYLASSTNPSITIETVEVLDPAYGTKYEVKFARPEPVPIDVKITVARQNYTGSNLEADVKNAILAWAAGENAEVDGLIIGGSVSPFEISAAVSSEIPEIFIREVLINKNGSGSPAATTITLDAVQKGTVSADNITVVIVETA